MSMNYPMVDTRLGAIRDLAPNITRQRLVLEGYPKAPIKREAIVAYLTELSDRIGMTTLISPVTHRSDLYGWAGWIHWETSGAHFYAWDSLADGSPFLFFSVDIYTCKSFDASAAADFTRQFFGAAELETIEW